MQHFSDSLYSDRVNSAFLDRLEGRGRGSEEAAEEEEEDVGQQQLPVAHLNPEHSDLDWTLEDTGERRARPLVLTPFFSRWLTEAKSRHVTRVAHLILS